MYQWIETLALSEGALLRLDYHQERLRQTLIAHGATNMIDLDEALSKLILPSNGYYKLRIIYDVSGVVEIACDLYFPKIWRSFEVIEATELLYDYKSTDRHAFEELKQMSSCDEVIISKGGLITDTTYSNLVFEKGGQWFTPSSYLLAGTHRQYLLDKGIIKEARITTSNLTSFQNFKMINAMMPFESSHIYPVELIQISDKSLFPSL